MRLAAAAAVTCLLCAPAAAGSLLSEEQATRQAAEFLKGGDFGGSYYDVVPHLKQAKLIDWGWTQCGRITAPVWAFKVQRPYDGWLYLDAASGRKVCSSIPFHR